MSNNWLVFDQNAEHKYTVPFKKQLKNIRQTRKGGWKRGTQIFCCIQDEHFISIASTPPVWRCMVKLWKDKVWHEKGHFMNCEKKNFLVLKLLQTCIFKYSFVCVKKKIDNVSSFEKKSFYVIKWSFGNYPFYNIKYILKIPPVMTIIKHLVYNT